MTDTITVPRALLKNTLDTIEHHGGHLPWNAFVEVRKDLRSALEQQEPESFEEWNAKQHGDPEEIGFLQALRIAYCAGQDSVRKAAP